MLKVPQKLRGSRGQEVVHYDVRTLETLRKKEAKGCGYRGPPGKLISLASLKSDPLGSRPNIHTKPLGAFRPASGKLQFLTKSTPVTS